MPPASAFEPVVADDRAVMDGWFALRAAARRNDLPDFPPPCPVEHVARLDGVHGHRDVRAWVVREDGRVVAGAELGLPLRDNLTAAGADIVVAPDQRRRGLGRRLLAHVCAQARAAGRRHLWVEVLAPLDVDPPGSGFLRAAGAHPALFDLRSELVLRPGDPTRDRLAEQVRAAAHGYALVQWTGATPAAWQDDLAALVARMSTDPPMGELSLEPERWDAERIRARDAADALRGRRTLTTAARGPDGHLAGYTTILVAHAHHGCALQGDTIVAPEHRGHRLGLLVKLANLDLLVAARPDVTRIGTYNSRDNRWMLAVNTAMGYRPRGRLVEWELNLRTGQAGSTAAISAAASGP